MKLYFKSLVKITAIGIFFIVIFFLSGSYVFSQGSAGVLKAGIAKLDITPDLPVQMSGYGSRTELSIGVHDNLYARVVAFENNGKRLVLISTDVIGYYGGTYEFILKSIQEESGLRQDEVFLCGIHSHSAPTVTINDDIGHQNNIAYTQILRPKIVKVVREALNSLTPVKTGIGVGYSPVGINRRRQNERGMIELGRNPYGPTDKEVLVMKLVRSDNGSPITALFDYACHATSLGPKNLLISGDVLGIAAQFVENILGKGLIAPEFAGASGNIDPWFRVLPEFNTEPGWIPEPVLLGTLLGEEVVTVFRGIKNEQPGGEIKTAFTTIEAPAKKFGEVEQRTDGLSAPANKLTTPVNITAARVGDVVFIGFNVEMLTEVGMAIKAGSPFKNTFVISHCNGATGYLPPEYVYSQGGYEVKSSPFAPQAADVIVKQALKMIYGL